MFRVIGLLGKLPIPSTSGITTATNSHIGLKKQHTEVV